MADLLKRKYTMPMGRKSAKIDLLRKGPGGLPRPGAPGGIKRVPGDNHKIGLQSKIKTLTTKARTEKFLPGGDPAKAEVLHTRLQKLRRKLIANKLGSKGMSRARGIKNPTKRRDLKAHLLQKKLGKGYLDYFDYKGTDPRFRSVPRPKPKQGQGPGPKK